MPDIDLVPAQTTAAADDSRGFERADWHESW
jgi:hypothetical protein